VGDRLPFVCPRRFGYCPDPRRRPSHCGPDWALVIAKQAPPTPTTSPTTGGLTDEAAARLSGAHCLVHRLLAYAAARYSISADNVRTLRTFKGQTVNVGAFTAAKPGQTEITCRGVGPIKTPDGEPFEQFIRKAFLDEMTIAELYVPDAPVSLTGRLDSIDFSSGIGEPWSIALTRSRRPTDGSSR
jgi:hypothetical protein